MKCRCVRMRQHRLLQWHHAECDPSVQPSRHAIHVMHHSRSHHTAAACRAQSLIPGNAGDAPLEANTGLLCNITRVFPAPGVVGDVRACSDDAGTCAMGTFCSRALPMRLSHMSGRPARPTPSTPKPSSLLLDLYPGTANLSTALRLPVCSVNPNPDPCTR